MEELTELIQKLWRDGYLPKTAYAELLNFTNEHQALQLLQPDVSSSDYEIIKRHNFELTDFIKELIEDCYNKKSFDENDLKILSDKAKSKLCVV